MNDQTYVSEIVQEAIKAHGGIPQYPEREFVEIRPREIIDTTPLTDQPPLLFFRQQQEEANLQQQLLTGDIQRIMSTLHYSSRNRIGTHFARRFPHVDVIWVADHEDYDAERNVLMLYGHYRIHVFHFWVAE